MDILAKGIFGVLAGVFVYPVVRYLIPPQRASRDSGVIEVNAAEIEMGKSKVVNYKETPTIVINTAEGLFAMSAVCTHLGCIVQWDETSKEIVCPCHGAKYDLNGNVKSGPAPKPLTLVRASMAGDKIIIGEA
ncbi:MAG: Rieske 2Fe-2S domain-containing protein [bacterium]